MRMNNYIRFIIWKYLALKNFLINLAFDHFTGDGFGSIIVQFTFLFF